MLKVISSGNSETSKMDENKAKALAAALSQIEKQFGKGSIMKLGDADVEKGIEVVSTGSLGLDMALGVGGLPRRSSPTSRSLAAPPPSSTRSTRSTPSMRNAWASIRRSCSSRSPTTASRPSRSSTCWCVPPRSTAS